MAKHFFELRGPGSLDREYAFHRRLAFRSFGPAPKLNEHATSPRAASVAFTLVQPAFTDDSATNWTLRYGCALDVTPRSKHNVVLLFSRRIRGALRLRRKRLQYAAGFLEEP
ncbi:MAG: hypothetical protein ABJB74_03120 [Gemmatimonas sp.]